MTNKTNGDGLKPDQSPQEDEMIHQNIVRFSPMGIHQYTLKQGGRLEFIGGNPAADRILGIDHSLLIGKTIEEAFPMLAGTEVPDRYREAAKSGNVWQTEQIEYEDKRIRGAFQVTAFKVKENGMVAVFSDISDRKRAEEALQRSEERYRRLIETTNTGYVILDINGVVVDANPEYVRLSGHAKLDEILGRSVMEWTAEEEKETNARAVAACLKTGFIRNFEITYIDPKGNRTPVEINGTVMESKGERQILTLCRDITERKQAEIAATAEKERLAVTLRSIGDAVIATDVRGDIVLMNKVAEDLTGWRLSEATGKPLSDIFNVVNELTREHLENPVEKVLSSGKIIELANHTLLISRDGTERVIADSGAPIRDEHNKIIGVVLVFRDITERQQFMDAIQRTAKLDSLGILAGGIAHDFNNLLTGIYGYMDLARLASKDARISEYLEAMLATMKRAKALTLQLLTFAKGGSPVQKITPLIPFIEETAQFALSGSNISCRFSFADDLCKCNIDKDQIAQVIDNIVINAQQAMPDGGTIEIYAANLSFKENEHPPLSKGDYVKVSIKDTGIGIPKEILPRIFDPFFTTKLKGHGLGLATCHSIITRHGGCIDAESQPGKGSAFHVYLPASLEATEAKDATVSMHKGSGTIIVMDDEAVLRDTIRQMLELMGYTVICKHDGKEAVDFFMSETPKRPFVAMIFDLTVPGGMGGLEAVMEIRKSDKEIPIFVSSGYAENSVMKNPVEYGFTASIAKPFTLGDLSEVLNNHLAT